MEVIIVNVRIIHRERNIARFIVIKFSKIVEVIEIFSKITFKES
jgi:hypothetical protein